MEPIAKTDDLKGKDLENTIMYKQLVASLIYFNYNWAWYFQSSWCNESTHADSKEVTFRESYANIVISGKHTMILPLKDVLTMVFSIKEVKTTSSKVSVTLIMPKIMITVGWLHLCQVQDQYHIFVNENLSFHFNFDCKYLSKIISSKETFECKF